MGYAQLFIIFITVLVSVLWIVLAHDLSTALTVGQWLFGGGQVSYGLVVIFSEMVNFWRY